MKPCKICGEPQSGGYIICADCAEKYEAMEADKHDLLFLKEATRDIAPGRLMEICQAERDGRLFVCGVDLANGTDVTAYIPLEAALKEGHREEADS